ncbi:hypothetical protein [Salsipaludibacter albus]|uniref:hypothetical protein n=1 Tax=Salsipaludibacter albus TaxID=2849650 RepID=UPI001EE4A0C7|nr:hypothetical protein [Salsipaludibacter albus]MBY5163528.1 hypothetical protein [Salsipaludibacter albus]
MSTFDFDFDPSWAWLVRLSTGANPDNSHVTVGDQRLVVDFGWLGIETPLANVRDVRITRDYKTWKALGARGSLADRGATYGTNARGGVCICFHEPVHALPLFANPGLTVTVADLDGLADTLRVATGLPA